MYRLRVGRAHGERGSLAIDSIHQRLEADGLDEMGLEPGLARTTTIALLPIAAHGDEPQILWNPRQTAQPPRELVTVHRWQPDVEERDLRPERPRDLEGARSIACDDTS